MPKTSIRRTAAAADQAAADVEQDTEDGPGHETLCEGMPERRRTRVLEGNNTCVAVIKHAPDPRGQSYTCQSPHHGPAAGQEGKGIKQPQVPVRSRAGVGSIHGELPYLKCKLLLFDLFTYASRMPEVMFSLMAKNTYLSSSK